MGGAFAVCPPCAFPSACVLIGARTPLERGPNGVRGGLMTSEQPDEVRLTYRQLAERLGISPDSARNKARRRHWQVTLDNRGTARVRVPLDELPSEPREPLADPRSEPRSHPDQPGVQEELNRARERIAQLEAELIEAKIRVGATEKTEQAKEAALREVIALLERQLERERARADRPWWRWLVGG